MKHLIKLMAIYSSALFTSQVSAHHSFSAFDFKSTKEITGTLTRFDIIQPHVKLALEITLEDGSIQNWDIESVVPRQWRLRELDPEFAAVGENVTLIGWAANNGSEHMMLKTMVAKKGTMVVRDDLGEDGKNVNGQENGGGMRGNSRGENRERVQRLREEN